LLAVEQVVRAISAEHGGQPHERLTFNPIASLDDLFGEIACCEAVVASRYHNVICALVLGRPVIALGYAKKFDALMSDVGLVDYCRNIEEFEVQDLSHLLLRMMSDKDRLSATVRHSVNRYRRELNALFDSTFGTEEPGTV
jgi:polysaccharide pyruvyl transferase WcaK-like protein